MGPGENNSPRLKEPKFGRLNFRFTVTTCWPILNQNSTGQQKKQKKKLTLLQIPMNQHRAMKFDLMKMVWKCRFRRNLVITNAQISQGR